MAMNGSDLRAWLAQMGRRLSMLAARAVVRLVNNLAARQRLQLVILADELQDDVERAQDCGFTSHPLPGAVRRTVWRWRWRWRWSWTTGDTGLPIWPPAKLRCTPMRATASCCDAAG
jgi:hypothetical protein